MDKILVLSIVYMILLIIVMLNSDAPVKFMVLIVVFIGVLSSIMYYKYKVRYKC